MKTVPISSMNIESLDPWSLTVFLIISTAAAGVLYFIWLFSPFSKPFKIPIDGSKTYRGKRIFGANKTFRGLIGMGLAVGFSFFMFGFFRDHLPDWVSAGMWNLSPSTFGMLGIWAGIGFMAGELPNSFIKRQLDISPGKAPTQIRLRYLFFVIDHCDSILGMLVALSLVVYVPIQTWTYLLVVGPGIHLFFSLLLFLLRGKERIA